MAKKIGEKINNKIIMGVSSLVYPDGSEENTYQTDSGIEKESIASSKIDFINFKKSNGVMVEKIIDDGDGK